MLAERRRRQRDAGRRRAQVDAAAHELHFPHDGVLRLDRESVRLDLRVLEDFVHRVERRRRHVVLLELAEPIGARVVIFLPAVAIAEARIFRPFGLAYDVEEPAPEFLRRGQVNNEWQPFAVGEGEDAGGRHACRAPRYAAGFEEAHGVLARKGNGRAQQRGFDALSFAGLEPVHQRAQDAVAGVNAGKMVGEGDAHTLRLLWIGTQTQQAAHRLPYRVVAGPVAIRPRLTEARDRAINDFWIQRPDRFIAHAAPLERAGPEVFDDDIRAGRELEKNLPRGVLSNVECQAFLVAVEAAKIGRVKIVAPAPERIALAGLLELHDVRAHIGEQQPGERPRHVARDLNHPYTLQRAAHKNAFPLSWRKKCDY